MTRDSTGLTRRGLLAAAGLAPVAFARLRSESPSSSTAWLSRPPTNRTPTFDLGIDFGTSETRVCADGRGVVCSVDTRYLIRVATGDDVGGRGGHLPPLNSHGQDVWHNADAAAALMRLVLTEGRNWQQGWEVRRPRVAVAVPSRSRNQPTICALKNAGEAAGAREVAMVEKGRLIAAGAGVFTPPADTEANAVAMADVGAGTTELALLARGELFVSYTLPFGGESFDGALVQHFANRHGLAVPLLDARSIKEAVSAITTDGHRDEIPVFGRDALTGMVHRAFGVTRHEMREVLDAASRPLAHMLRRALQTIGEKRAAPRPARILLTGRGGLVPSLPPRVMRLTRFACERTPNADCLLQGLFELCNGTVAPTA
jgi:actin-like ATPase involved in cell morphogenesis